MKKKMISVFQTITIKYDTFRCKNIELPKVFIISNEYKYQLKKELDSDLEIVTIYGIPIIFTALRNVIELY